MYGNQAQPESAILKRSGLHKKNRLQIIPGRPEHMMVGETKLFFYMSYMFSVGLVLFFFFFILLVSRYSLLHRWSNGKKGKL